MFGNLGFEAPWWVLLAILIACAAGAYAVSGMGQAGRWAAVALNVLAFVFGVGLAITLLHDSGWNLGFDAPWWLLLLGLIPMIWILSYRSLAGLGKFRRLVAIGLRTVVLLLIVLCLAEAQLLKTSEKLTVMYLLDQSESVPRERREAMMHYVIRAVAKHRNADREDAAGVIIFGREAKIESAPLSDDIPSVGVIESLIDLRTDATNLEAALKLAQATFPEDTARRLVIVTDGNENIGNAREVARMLADKSIGYRRGAGPARRAGRDRGGKDLDAGRGPQGPAGRDAGGGQQSTPAHREDGGVVRGRAEADAPPGP
jgi:hypothetical protein